MSQQTYLLTGFMLAVIAATPAFGAEPQGNDDLTVVWGTAVNYKAVSFEVGRKKFDPTYVTLDLALTMAYRGFYLGGNYDVSLKDFVTINNTPNGGGGFDNSVITFSREDLAATFGYNVWNAMNVFAGYRQGKTAAISSSDLTGPIPDPARNSDIVFLTKGPFIGTSYGFAMGKRGTLLLSAAYAAMSGDVTFLDYLADGTRRSNNVQGPANGYSVGLGWTGPLEGSLFYTVAYKYSKYSFDQDNATDPRDNLSFDEVHSVFTLSMQKYF